MTMHEQFATGSQIATPETRMDTFSTFTSQRHFSPDGSQLPTEVVERLEALDDVIFAAIDGNARALQDACFAWETAVRDLGWEVVEESRQQYLRCAQSIWDESRRHPDDSPHYPFAAIEIIGLLAQ